MDAAKTERDADRVSRYCDHVQAVNTANPDASVVRPALQRIELARTDIVFVESLGGIDGAPDFGQDVTVLADGRKLVLDPRSHNASTLRDTNRCQSTLPSRAHLLARGWPRQFLEHRDAAWQVAKGPRVADRLPVSHDPDSAVGISDQRDHLLRVIAHEEYRCLDRELRRFHIRLPHSLPLPRAHCNAKSPAPPPPRWQKVSVFWQPHFAVPGGTLIGRRMR